MESNSDIAVDLTIKCVRGDSFSRELTFWQDDETTPIDISLWDFRMQVRPDNNSSALLSFQVGNGFVITAPNVLVMSKTAEEIISAYREVPLKYDIERIVDGKIETIMRGDFIIVKDYTI